MDAPMAALASLERPLSLVLEAVGCVDVWLGVVCAGDAVVDVEGVAVVYAEDVAVDVAICVMVVMVAETIVELSDTCHFALER